VFHNDNFRTLWLNEIRRAKGLAERPLVDTQAQKEIQYERLAAYARKYLDIDYIMSIIKKEI
ncbi:MAG: cobyric acid synthase, partial [Firmicutes bacterium]|nr:cobyric acid synthase [Bacillota bacterium]